MQTLNQCYAQLHQQQTDLGFLQGQFQQLFSGNASPAGPSRYPPGPPSAASGMQSTNPFSTAGSTGGTTTFPSLHTFSNQAPPMFTNPGDSPFNPFSMPSFQANETPGFTPATLNQSDLQWPRSAVSQPGPLRAPSWMPVFTEPAGFPSQSTQTDHMANPDTGVPSPRFSGLGSVTVPSSVPRTTAASNVSTSTVPNNYNPSAYAGNFIGE